MQAVVAISEFAASRNLLVVPGVASDGASQTFVYSKDKTRRYAYSEVWEPEGSLVLWVMFNPGTGETELRRRNTLERCKVWARSWGHGGLLIGNVVAERTKAAKEVRGKLAPEPMNLEALGVLRSLSAEVLVAWGSSTGRSTAVGAVVPLLHGAQCLGRTKQGHPRHPLYVPGATNREPWSTCAASDA